MNTKYALRVAAAAATLTIGLTACSSSGLQGLIANRGCKVGARVFLVPDVSGSTAPQRGINGPYERGMMQALKTAARACAEVYSAPSDANSLGDGTWVIDGQTFRETIGGNASFGAAAREKKAEELLPTVRRELHMGQPSGTDILGSMQRIRIAIQSLHIAADRPVQVVFLTDGALNLVGNYSVYNTPLNTAERRTNFVARLSRLGELPDFGNKVNFYIGGLGIGASRDKAQDIIATWQLLVEAMHARLISADATLRFP